MAAFKTLEILVIQLFILTAVSVRVRGAGDFCKHNDLEFNYCVFGCCRVDDTLFYECCNLSQEIIIFLVVGFVLFVVVTSVVVVVCWLRYKASVYNRTSAQHQQTNNNPTEEPQRSIRDNSQQYTHSHPQTSFDQPPPYPDNERTTPPPMYSEVDKGPRRYV